MARRYGIRAEHVRRAEHITLPCAHARFAVLHQVPDGWLEVAYLVRPRGRRPYWWWRLGRASPAALRLAYQRFFQGR